LARPDEVRLITGVSKPLSEVPEKGQHRRSYCLHESLSMKRMREALNSRAPGGSEQRSKGSERPGEGNGNGLEGNSLEGAAWVWGAFRCSGN